MAITRAFTGKLNMDVSPYRMPPEDYSYAKNVTRDAQKDLQDGPISNIVGNRVVGFSFPEDTVNICIGSRQDPLRGNIIYFVWNNEGFHSILRFEESTRLIYRIFQSRTESDDIDILNFQLLYKVNDIDIVHRDEDGDLLLWNDAYNRPGQLNIQDFESGLYGSSVTDDLIRLARIPGLDELNPSYKDDNSQLVNNLKKKLFQFTYAWVYKNGEISTIAPISKVALPVSAGEVETESDPGKDNVIELQVVGGPEDYKSIRIFGRENINNVWGDWFIVDTLDRDDYGIDPGNTYTYRFLNDGQYISADQRYMDLNFDNSADKCNTQGIVNGNVITQAGITNGYDPIKRADVNVQIISELVDTDGSDADPANPTITYVSSSPFPFKRTDFTIGPSISEGCFYSIKFHVPVFDAPDYNPSASYTVLGGGTVSDVAQALATSLNSQMNPTASRKAEYIAPNIIRVTNITYQIDSIITSATSPVFFTGGSATWKWAAKYRLGLVYVDKYGKTNGVVSFVSSIDDPTDFALTTASFDFNVTSGAPKIPVINASINHIPPSWAVAYYWVRTPNQTTDSFLEYVTAEVQGDVSYWYFCIENLNVFRTETTGFVPSYTFKSGDRLRVYASVNSGSPAYTNYPVNDYEILGTVQRDMTITTGTATQGLFLKVKKPQASPPTYADNVFIEIYTPFLRSGDSTTVFYAFGESYPIYVDPITGIHYHVGQIDNQTESQPATFQFRDGDVYYKFREMYKLNEATGKIDPTTVYQVGLMDANYSDYWNSAVNSNSRGWVIDPNAKRLYEPALIRHGQAYQPGTDINGLNRFYAEDFIEVIRDYGDIMKIKARNNVLVCAQKLKIGRLYVDQQMTYNVDGTSNLILSSKLLNTIQYYNGEYGIGDCPESFAMSTDSIYGWDNLRGVCWRLAQNGLTPISIIGQMNNFAVTESKTRGFNYKIYGVFDTYTSLYISALEYVPGISQPQTLVWNELRNGFESFTSYYPEMMCCLNNLLVTWKDGQLYTHDNPTYNIFYGIIGESLIRPVFGDGVLTKKTFQNVTLSGDNVWEISEMSTNVIAYQNIKQTSKVTAGEFKYQEGEWYAALRGAMDVNGKTTNGAPLKGAYLIATFRIAEPTTQVVLNAIQIGVAESNKNTK